MNDKERFEGLKRAAVARNEKEYGAEARARYGEDAVDGANARVLSRNEKEWSNARDTEEEIKQRLADLVTNGADPAGNEAQRLVSLHAGWVSSYWAKGTFTKAAYRALAQGYLADERFCAYYDGAAGEGATKFLVAAIEAYCEASGAPDLA